MLYRLEGTAILTSMKTPVLVLTSLLLLPASGAAAPTEAPAAFAVAKLLADEGSFREALAAFERAVHLAPEDAYVRAEYAEFLTRLAELSHSPQYREEQLQRAVAQAEAAAELAPKDLDVQQVLGNTFLAVAEANPRNPVPLERAVDAFEVVRQGNPGALRTRFTLGQIYGYQGRWADASAVYREVIEVSPRDRRAYERLVDALFNAGQGQEAEASLKDLLAFDPEASEARLTLAELAAQRGEHQAAIELLEGGSEEFRGSERARQHLAVQYYMVGNLDGSMAELEALGDRGRTGNLGALRALILSAQGNNEEAVVQLQDLLEKDPEDAELASTLGRILRRQGKPGEAVKVLRGATERLEEGGEGERAVSLRFEWAEALMAAGEWQEAVDVLGPLQSAESPPLRIAAGLLASDALVRLERQEEALALLRRTGPEDATSQARRALILDQLGREDEAKEVISKLEGAGGEESVLAAASLHQGQGRHGDAIRVLEAFLDANDATSVRGLFLLGASYERSGQHKEAEAAFRRLLELEPDFPEALNYLGYMWAERGENLEEALELIEKAVAMDPDNGAYVDSLGWVYYKMGRHEDALTQLRRAARLVPGDGTILEHLGDAYMALKQFENAREAYLQALELDDANSQQIREKLGPLTSRTGEEGI